jgi:hypothetical protein
LNDTVLKDNSFSGCSYDNNTRLIHHPKEALIFRDVLSVWLDLKLTYSNDFKNLVYGEFPKEKEILDTPIGIKQSLETVTWSIRT